MPSAPALTRTNHGIGPGALCRRSDPERVRNELTPSVNTPVIRALNANGPRNRLQVLCIGVGIELQYRVFGSHIVPIKSG